MMKKLFPLLALLLLIAFGAVAEEANDLTLSCEIKTSGSEYKTTQMTDRNYNTRWLGEKRKSPYIQITSPDEKVCGVYVCFGAKPFAWNVQVKKDGQWTTVAGGEGKYAHEYVELSGLSSFRITPASDKSMTMSLLEIRVFGAGDVPAWVNRWEDAPEKVDLLVISAHPDDELLFFGGTIPYYAAERDMDVMVAYMTCNTTRRRSELLDGLWTCGVRLYPDIGDFWDKYATSLQSEYDAWGKTKTNERLVGLFRKYKPDVVVTHDVDGEYGHGGHMVCANAVIKSVPLAADPEKFSNLAAEYGVWAVKKVYLHLYAEGGIEMDWDQPLAAFGGMTGFEVAQAGYQHHVSQHTYGQNNKKTGKYELFAVEPRDSDYSCYRFGLAYSAVGEDTLKNDFFENITTETGNGNE